MKRKPRIVSWLALLLAGALLLGIAACGDKKGGDDATDIEETTTETEPTTEEVVADLSAWRIEIRGVPGIVKFDSLDAEALPQVETEMTTTNSSGFTVTSRYKGITLRSLLAYINVQYVSSVTVSSMDGNTATYNADMVMADDTLLAWEMDGAPIETVPPLRMCPGSGTADDYVKLVSTINVRIGREPATTVPTTLPTTYTNIYYPPYNPPATTRPTTTRPTGTNTTGPTGTTAGTGTTTTIPGGSTSTTVPTTTTRPPTTTTRPTTTTKFTLPTFNWPTTKPTTTKPTSAPTTTVTTTTTTAATTKVTGIDLYAGKPVTNGKTTMEVGEKLPLSWTVSPPTATNQDVYLASVFSDIASIDDPIDRVNCTCVVTANKAGTTTIRVTTWDGNYRATLEITVIDPPPPGP